MSVKERFEGVERAMFQIKLKWTLLGIDGIFNLNADNVFQSLFEGFTVL